MKDEGVSEMMDEEMRGHYSPVNNVPLSSRCVRQHKKGVIISIPVRGGYIQPLKN